MCIALGACSSPSTRASRISWTDLSTAPPATFEMCCQAGVSDWEALAGLYRPLGPRLGVLVLTTPEHWAQARRAIPMLGPRPDLQRGAWVGIISQAGRPLDGAWPLRLTSARLHQGQVWLCAEFEPGTYLVDGTGLVTGAYFPGMRDLAVAQINDERFYPPLLASDPK